MSDGQTNGLSTSELPATAVVTGGVFLVDVRKAMGDSSSVVRDEAAADKVDDMD